MSKELCECQLDIDGQTILNTECTCAEYMTCTNCYSGDKATHTGVMTLKGELSLCDKCYSD
jgi:hypothetical protein